MTRLLDAMVRPDQVHAPKRCAHRLAERFIPTRYNNYVPPHEELSMRNADALFSYMKPVLVGFFTILLLPFVAFAAWDGSPYTPGSTLTPECAPSNSNCTVSPMPVSLGGTGNAALKAGYIPFGAGTSAFATSSALYFDSTNGRLGIGTSTPYSALSVWGGSSGNILEVVTSASTTALSVSATGFGTTTVTGFVVNGSATSTSNVGWNLTGGCFAINGTCVSGSGLTGTTGQTAYFSGTDSAVGTSTIFVSTASKVGIGTTTPSMNFVVQSSSGLAANFVSTAALSSTGGANVDFRTNSVPTASGNQLGALYFGSDGSGLRGASMAAYAEGAWSGSSVPGYFTFSTVSSGSLSMSERMRITSAGNVGIGTTSPYAKLSVVGPVVAEYLHATSTTATSTFAGGLNVQSGAITHDYSAGLTTIQNLAFGAISFDTDAGIVTWADMPVTSSASAGTVMSYSANIAGTSTMTVYAESTGSGGAQNFRVGVGTTSPWRTFDVNGTVGVNGLTAGAGAGALCLSANKEVTYSDGAGCTGSSIRFKHDVVTLEDDALEKVLALRPVSFLYNDDIGVPGTQVGFIAEEVDEIDSRLVTYDKDGVPANVKYANFTALLAKAFQQLYEKISGFAEQFTTKKLCVGETCVTEEQFRAMVEVAGQTSSAPTPPPKEDEQEQGEEQEDLETDQLQEEQAPQGTAEEGAGAEDAADSGEDDTGEAPEAGTSGESEQVPVEDATQEPGQTSDAADPVIEDAVEELPSVSVESTESDDTLAAP